MKQLELELKKRFLIVELPENSTGVHLSGNNIIYNLNGSIWVSIIKSDVKLICKASELTEEISETLISKNDVIKSQSKMCGLKFKEGLIKMIESKGYYWGENPIEKPENYESWAKYGDYTQYGIKLTKKCMPFCEAESKTFNLSKTLIFEIL